MKKNLSAAESAGWSIVDALVISGILWICCWYKYGTVLAVPINMDRYNHEAINRLWDPLFLAPLLFVCERCWKTCYWSLGVASFDFNDCCRFLAGSYSFMASLIVMFVGWTVVWLLSLEVLAGIGAIWCAVRGTGWLLTALCILGQIWFERPRGR